MECYYPAQKSSRHASMGGVYMISFILGLVQFSEASAYCLIKTSLDQCSIHMWKNFRFLKPPLNVMPRLLE